MYICAGKKERIIGYHYLRFGAKIGYRMKNQYPISCRIFDS